MNKTVSVGILATLKVKPGKEDDVEEFLKSALPLANQEAATTVWFALRIGPSTFGIFDAFTDETGRAAHLSGRIASALNGKMAGASFGASDNRKGGCTRGEVAQLRLHL